MTSPNVVKSINVSYPSLAPIFTYSKLEDRRRMAKWIPALRVTQKTAPFIFETVSLSSEDDINSQIQFDGVIWRFRTENNWIWTRNSKMNLVNEEGNVLKSNLTLANNVNRIVRYFLIWRTLRIKHFQSDGYFQVWAELIRIPIIENVRISQEAFLKECLKSFWITKVGRLELHQYSEQKMTEQLSNIECDDVKIYVRDSYQLNVSYVSLPFKKLRIFETSYSTNRFCNFVEKFRAGRHEVGSAYTGLYKCYTDGVWATLKARYPLKIEDKYFLIIATDKPDRDLLVERRMDFRFSCYKHSVKVIESSSEELKRIKSGYPRIVLSPKELAWLLHFIILFLIPALIYSYDCYLYYY